MRFALIFVLALSAAVVSFGQETGSISGKVTLRGEAVPGAGVTLTSTTNSKLKFAAVTDGAGTYRLSQVPEGVYVIDFSSYYVGGMPRQQGLDWRGEIREHRGEEKVLDIDFDKPMPYREEVVVVASGTEQPLSGVSKTVDVIDAQEMRDRADFSLSESLRTIPGFRVQQSGGFGKVATIKTRGLRNQDTALLLDGIRFRDVTAITGDASPFLSDLTLTSVNAIEVLRGSGSSLYGTNAIGGTIDLKTPEARVGTHGQIGGAVGGLGLGRFRGNMSHGTSDGKFGIGAGVSRTVYWKGIDGDDRAANTNFQSRFDADPWPNTNISGRIFVSSANVRLNSNPDTKGLMPSTNSTIIDAQQGVNFVFDANDPDSSQRSKFFDGQIVVNQVVNSQFLISGYYQGLTTKRTNDNGSLGVGFQSASTSVFDGTTHTANVHFNWTLNRTNTLTAGYEFENEGFGNDGKTPSGTANFFVHAGQRSNTYYAQDLVSLLGGDLQLAGGLRVQRYSLDRPGFSLSNAPYASLTLSDPPTAYTFDGAASYFIRRSGTKLRAHVGNGYRVPSLYERFGTFYDNFSLPNRFVALGDPFLKPEKTIAFDAGVEQYAARERVRLSATYFYTRLIDIIGFGTGVPNIGATTRPFGGYQNQKGGVARGGEFSAKVKATSMTEIIASYTYTNSTQRTPQVSASGVFKTLGIPDHQFTLVVTQRIRRAWVNFDLLATSDYLAPIFSNSTFNTYVYRFQGNRKGDLTGGYTFGFKREKLTLRLYGTVENIFNQEYYENGFRTARRTARMGMSFGF